MSRLSGRRIVLGVCGSVAAFKSVEICRLLIDAGAHVLPVMTTDAQRFVGSATLSALASEPVRLSLWDETGPIPHTSLGRSADVIVVAPATARLLGTYAAGIADSLLSATLLASAAPVVLAPAMHTEMWEHPATRANLETLLGRGVVVVEPATGRLAGGDTGAGRLAEPADIVAATEEALAPRDLAGVSVLITAGGTREPMDPVRFLGNRSSGRQGAALAAEAAARGARVTLVTTLELAVRSGTEVVRVTTAAEMADAVLRRTATTDVLVMAAAVADFRPKAAALEKLAKRHGVPELLLEPTTDIAAELGRRRRPEQVLVAFAAETAEGEELARRGADKLRSKGMDLVVANPVSAFESETTAAVMVRADGTCEHLPTMTKRALAARVVDVVAGTVVERRTSGGIS